MRKIFTIFLLVSMMCVSICGCSSASARQETLLTIEEKTEVDALETAITATDANQTIEEPEEEAVRHTEGVDGFSDDIDYLSTIRWALSTAIITSPTTRGTSSPRLQTTARVKRLCTLKPVTALCRQSSFRMGLHTPMMQPASETAVWAPRTARRKRNHT